MSVLFKNVLRKIAAGNDGKAPAMIGTWPYMPEPSSTVFTPLGTGTNPYFAALYSRTYPYGNVTMVDSGVPGTDVYRDYLMGTPITNEQLVGTRRRQAEINAEVAAGSKFTPQYESAKNYLMQRGAENEANFKSGDLYKGGPRPKSKIQLPNNIKDPAMRKKLEEYGNMQVNNNIPGGGRGQGFGIG